MREIKVDSQRQQRIGELMARMAAGDEAAAITLYHEFRGELVGFVGRLARSLGASHLTAEDLEGLAIDVCLDLVPRAGAWRPGGALPWVWATKAARSLVSQRIGQYGRPLDRDPGEPGDRGEGPVFAGPDPDEVETLARVARWMPECALLRDALAAVASDRNAAVFLFHRAQASAGDPEPGITTAGRFGLRHDNARKIVSRVTAAFRDLALRDATYRDLLLLPILCGERAA